MRAITTTSGRSGPGFKGGHNILCHIIHHRLHDDRTTQNHEKTVYGHGTGTVQYPSRVTAWQLGLQKSHLSVPPTASSIYLTLVRELIARWLTTGTIWNITNTKVLIGFPNPCPLLSTCMTRLSDCLMPQFHSRHRLSPDRSYHIWCNLHPVSIVLLLLYHNMFQSVKH